MPVSADRFLLGVITSDLFLLAALGLGSVSNEPAPGMRLDICVVLSSTSGAVPWGHAEKGNHQLGKELTAAGGAGRILPRAVQMCGNQNMIISIPGAKVS